MKICSFVHNSEKASAALHLAWRTRLFHAKSKETCPASHASQARKMLIYGIVSRLKASDITTDRAIPTQPDQIRSHSYNLTDPADMALSDQAPTQEMKYVAKDMTAWCVLRWGGSFGAKAGTNSMGAKLGIWSDRFEDVRCAVMLLTFLKLNAALILKHQKARIGSNEPGTIPLHAL